MISECAAEDIVNYSRQLKNNTLLKKYIDIDLEIEINKRVLRASEYDKIWNDIEFYKRKNPFVESIPYYDLFWRSVGKTRAPYCYINGKKDDYSFNTTVALLMNTNKRVPIRDADKVLHYLKSVDGAWG